MESLAMRVRSSLPLWVVSLVLILLPLFLPNYATILVTQCLIYAIVAMSLDILIGYTGLAALGHSAFFAIGAYGTAILATKLHSGLGGAIFFSISAAAAASLTVRMASGKT